MLNVNKAQTLNLNQTVPSDKTTKAEETVSDKAKELKDRNGQISVDGSNLSQVLNPSVESKRESARKQALQIISDAWKRDETYASGIRKMEDEQEDLTAKIRELQSRIRGLDENKEALRQEYDVSEDSQEQKDLLLLEKFQKNKLGASFDHFSEEEIDRLKELQFQGTPLTEYQRRVLELGGAQSTFMAEIQDHRTDIIKLTGSIRAARLDHLKSKDMLDSQEAADKVLEASSREIIGMLMDEVKDHMEEVDEEDQEKAEKIQEKKEEKEEKIQQAKDKRKDQEELIKEDQKADKLELDHKIKEETLDYVAEAQKNIQRILEDHHLVNEDLKGIEIDLNF